MDDMQISASDSALESDADSLYLPPELWLKVAWYILVRPDEEWKERWKYYSTFRTNLTYLNCPRLRGRGRFPIFGLGYCNETASTLLRIPILGPTLRHYLASARGLTYKEIACAYRDEPGIYQRMQILESISPRIRSGNPEQRIRSVRIERRLWCGAIAKFRTGYRQHDKYAREVVILWITVAWNQSGNIYLLIERIFEGTLDWPMACKFLNGILPYGIEIRDMATFMEEMTIFVPSVNEYGDVEAIPISYYPISRSPNSDCHTCEYAEYRIEPESIVSRDMLRIRPNTIQ
jgi:hypothetical protein